MLCVKLSSYAWIGLLLAVFFLIGPKSARAIDCTQTPGDPACLGASSVTAIVTSNISPSLSTVVTDLSELPADGLSSVLITVTAINHDGAPAVGKEVSISSNRGEIETFSVYIGAVLQLGSSGLTNSSGVIRFTARSTAPGQATFTAVAETVTLDDHPTVSFTPLPLISNLVVTVSVPLIGGGTKDLTIFEPVRPTPSGPGQEKTPDTDKLINTQVQLRVPFWEFLLVSLIAILVPLALIWIGWLVRRVRKLLLVEQKGKIKEEQLLAQILSLEQQLAKNQEYDLAQNAYLNQEVAKTEAKLDRIVNPPPTQGP